MKETGKKILKSVLAAFLLSGSVCLRANAEEEGDPDFDQYLWEVFSEVVESDFLTMHYQVRDYESMGLERPEVTLGEIDLEPTGETEEYLEGLRSFDRSKLSPRQQRDYDVLEEDLIQDQLMEKYPDFQELFNTSSPLTDALITNFTEYVFYSKQDVEDYLTLVEEVPDYLDQAIEATKELASRGHFMTDNGLDEVKDGIKKFTEKTDGNEMIVDFEKDIDTLEFLSAEEKEDYKKRNRELILSQYIPAYEKVTEELEKLRGSRSVTGGLCEFENGEEYYRALVRAKASTTKSVEELIELCENIVMSSVFDLVTLMNRYPDVDDESYKVDMDSAEEVLKYLTGHLDDFPEGSENEFNVSYLDPSIANPNIVAYYMTPCIDAVDVNVIRVNGDAVNDVNDLYMTLAHEGFPGHQYQITWYLNTNPAPVRTILSHGGYTEGWAMYSETVASGYSGLPKGPAEYLKIMTIINYIIPCVADMGVNALGWTQQDVAASLDSVFLNSELAPSLYQEAVDSPGRLLSYGCGLAQFLNIRQFAEAELGGEFDPVEYHTVLLESGDRGFELVEADVQDWISRKTGKESTIDPSGTGFSGDMEALQQQSTINGLMILGVLLFVMLGVLLLLRKAKTRDPFVG